MARDFDNWYSYYLTNFGDIDIEIARKAYDEYFKCTCDTCMYRKEKGFIPIRQRPGCTAPENPDGVNDVVARLSTGTQT